MRTIGFIGLLFLAFFNAFGLYFAVLEQDLKGIALMIFMVVLLVFFGRTLWRGAKLARQTNSGERIADGWYGESVVSFLCNQVATSVEGRILISGTLACYLMALILLISPQTVSILPHRAVVTATFFGLWPILAFALYVKICGPNFVTTLFRILSVVAVVFAPFVFTYN